MPNYLEILKGQFQGSTEGKVAETDKAISDDKGLGIVPEEPQLTDAQRAVKGLKPDPIKEEPLPIEEPIEDAPKEPTPMEQADQQMADFYAPNMSNANKIFSENEPGTWTPEYTEMGFIEKSKESILRGFGKHVIGGTGDMLQIANLIIPGWDISEGNMLSRMLQEKGAAFAEEHNVYIPEELSNPEFNLKTFMSPDFWSGHIAEYIPQLVEFILLSKGGSGLAKKGAQSLVKGASKGVGKESLEALGTKVVENTGERLLKGAAKVTTESAGSGKGIIGKVFTTAGDATKATTDIAGIVGGGLSMNVLSGMLNAGQLVNQNKGLKDPDGNPLYTEQELSAMASGTMIHNLSYLPIDMLSWGMTYAKSTGAMERSANSIKKAFASGERGGVKARTFYSKADQLKYGAKSFDQALSPVKSMLKRAGKLAQGASKPLFEGYEETFQETFENWAQMKAKSEATGEEMKFKNYWDFYASPENEATKAISFALGGLGGGGAAIAENMNKTANDHYKLWNRAENLKHKMDKTRESSMMQSYHVSMQLIDNQLSKDGIDNDVWLDTMFDYGVIGSEEELAEQKAIAAEIKLDYDTAEAMNIKGKFAFLQNKAKKSFYEQAIGTEKEKMLAKVKFYEENLTNDKGKLALKKKEAGQKYEKLKKALMNELALATENIENLVSGEVATISRTKFVKDESGDTVAIGLDEKTYDDYYNKSDDQVYEEARKQYASPKGLFDRLSAKGKRIFSNISSSFDKKEDTPEEEALSFQTEVQDPEFTTQDFKVEKPVNEMSIEELDASLGSFDESNFPEATDEQKASMAVDKTTFEKYVADRKAEFQTKSEEFEAKKGAKVNKDGARGKAYKDIQEIEDIEGEEATDPEEDAPKKVDKAIQNFLSLAHNKESRSKFKSLTDLVDSSVKQIQEFASKLKLDLTDKEGATQKLLEKAYTATGLVADFANTNISEKALGEFLYELATQSEADAKKAKENADKTTPFQKAKKKVGDALNNVGNKIKDVTTNLAEEIQKAKNFQSQAYNKRMSLSRSRIYSGNFQERGGTQTELDAYLRSALALESYGPTAIHKARHLNQHLRVMFPEQQIQAYAMTNLMDSIGEDALGYAILSSVLIDEKVWDQDQIYMHEFAHIFYQLSDKTTHTMEFMKAVKRDKKLLEKILRTYQDQILYSVYDKETGERVVAEGWRLDKAELNRSLAEKDPLFKTTMLPLEEQAIILEEAFVARLQGPLSERFNKYFDSNDDIARQQQVKKWWKLTKDRGERKGLETDDVLRALNNGKKVAYGDVKSYIMNNFVETIQKPGVDVTIDGRASKEAVTEEARDIAHQSYEEARDAEFNNDLDARIKALANNESYVDPNEEVFVDEDFAELEEEREADTVFNLHDKTFDTHAARINKMIRRFSIKIRGEEKDKFNKALAAGTSNTAGETSDFREHKFKEHLMLLAKEEPYWAEYIRLLEESDDKYMKLFMAYLKENYDKDYLSRLSSAHLLYHNSEVITAGYHYVNSNGAYAFETALSQRENKMVELISKQYKNEAALTDAVEALINNTATRQDIEDIIKSYTNSSVNALAILNDGYLIVNQENMPIKSAIKKLMEQGLFKDRNGSYTNFDNADALIKALVNTNRQFSSLSIVLDPKGNNVSSRIIGNHLTKLMSNIRQDLKMMTQKEFVDKYSYIDKVQAKAKGETKVGTTNSPLLDAWWNNYNDFKEFPNVTMDLGSKNDMNETSTVYKKSTANQLLLNEALAFMDSVNTDKRTYMSTMDIFGDSNRKYVIGVPKYNDLFNDNGEMTVNGKKQFSNMYNLYAASRIDKSKEDADQQPLVSPGEFGESFKEAIMDWRNYMESNYNDLHLINAFTPMYDPATKKLNAHGKKQMNHFVFNRIANSFYMHQTMNPGIPLSSIIKRNKGNIAPVIALSENLRYEMIPWNREYSAKGIENNDSGQYILEKHALAIQKAGKGTIDFNKGYKLFSHSIERRNKNFMGQTAQMKGYTSVLKKEDVMGPNAKQPYLLPLYELLVARDIKFMKDYKSRTGKDYNENFANDGGMKYIPIITPVTSEKANLFTARHIKGFENLASLDVLKDENKFKEYEKGLDMLWYDKTGFVGLDGSNFGPQQVMDKDYKEATFSVQAMSSIIVGAKGLDLTAAIEIQNLLAEQKAEILQRNVLKHIKDGTDSKYTRFILKTANKNDADPLSIISLEDGMMPYFPNISIFANNQIKNQIIKNGNNLTLKGTYAQTVSDVGYRRLSPEGNPEYIKGSDTLNFYGEKLTADGKKSSTAMEVVLPQTQRETGVRERKSFYGENAVKQVKYLLKNNHLLLEEFGLTTDEQIDAFIENHTIHSERNGTKENQTGVYLPGESVMMTRIPHNGPTFMAVAEVVGFGNTGASNVMAPSEYVDMIGADHDGDALFVYKEGKDNEGDPDLNFAKWNKAFKMMKEQWLSPRMFDGLRTKLDFEDDVKGVISEINTELGVKKEKFEMPFSPKAYKKNFNNSVVAKQTVGIAFNNHRLINTLSAFRTAFLHYDKTGKMTRQRIFIGTQGDLAGAVFEDRGTGKESRIYQSTVLTNIVLDSTKNGHADALNINMETIGPAMVLVNLGFDLKSIGLLLNHPAAKDYVERFGDMNNDFINTGSRGQILRQMREENAVLKRTFFNNTNMINVQVNNPKSSNYNSLENKADVIRLMDYLYGVTEELQIVSKMMSGHNDLETNPYALLKQTEDFEQLLNNKKPKQKMFFTPKMKESNEVKSYVDTAKVWAEHQQKLSIVFNKAIKKVLNKITEQITTQKLTHFQMKHFSEMLKPFVYSRMLGINNMSLQEVEALFATGPDSVASMMQAEQAKLRNIVVNEHPSDPAKDETMLTRSRLFNEALQFDGNDVSINPTFRSNIITREDLNAIRNEFKALPEALQKGLIVYDLAKHGWENEGTIFSIFPNEILNTINRNLEIFQNADEDTIIPKPVLNEVYDVILNLEVQEPKTNFQKVFLNQELGALDLNSPTAKKEAYKEITKDKLFRMKIIGRVPFYVEIQSVNKKGKLNGKKIIKINPLSPMWDRYTKEVISEQNIAKEFPTARNIENVHSIPDADTHWVLAQHMASHLNMIAEDVTAIKRRKPQFMLADEAPKNAELITVNDGGTSFGLKKKVETEPSQKGVSINRGSSRGMAYRTDLNNFTGIEIMTQREFHNAMAYQTPVSDSKKEELYNKYLMDKEDANEKVVNFTPDKIVSMSDQQLLDHYKEYGSKDIYAYSNIVVPVLLELTARSSAEQSKITGRFEDGKDVGLIQSYFQANNIESNHPATQAIARQLETEFKGFINERKKYVRRINAVTEDLYREKFGYKGSKSALWNNMRKAGIALFRNRETVYDVLYGNIVDIENGMDSVGRPTKRIKLKSDSDLKRMLEKGNISKAEYNFAKTFREITGELHPFGSRPDFNTNNYVPAVGMDRLEAFSSKGLLGLLTNSKDYNQGLQDVRMMFRGTEQSFKFIEDTFRQEGGSSFKSAKDYLLLKNKAKGLLKKGINEDGSSIKTTSIQNRTLLGDNLVNRFATDGFVDAGQMISMDLNKALNEFIHTTLFVNGNENFQGFSKLQAQVDGLILHNKIKGYDNQAKYVRQVYKEYFLKGQRLKPDTPLDKVVETLTRGNLMYIMGWKLLIGTKGLYAIGNVVVGKYMNIKNQGGAAWIKGEKRFWQMNKSGSFGTRKAAGVLDNLNFMDVNLYDNVNITASAGLDSIFTDIAMMPMQYSEKWIQGVHFLGLLTEEQWNKFDDNGNYKEGEEPIKASDITELENEVKNAHGKGYTPTDQRLIQQYSWGKMMMQFSRFIPTMFYDRFSKEDINIYGKQHVGSLRSVWHLVYKVVSGEIAPKDVAAYRNNMSPEMRNRFDSGLKGLAMVTLAAFVGNHFNIETANELTGDANYLFNSEKLQFKLVPSAMRTTYDGFSSLLN